MAPVARPWLCRRSCLGDPADGHRPLHRRDRLDGARRAARPRVAAPGDGAATSTRCPRRSSATAARWRSSSATRSWPSSGSRPARGRRPACRAGGGRDARAARRAQRRARARLRRTLEQRIGDQHGRGRGRRRGGGQRLATGDAVNVAARLEQAARPGEILIGEATLRARPRRSRGRARSSRSPRRARASPSGLAAGRSRRRSRRRAPLESPLVGRRRELALLRRAFERAVEDRALPPRHGARAGRHRKVAARRRSSPPARRRAHAFCAAAASRTATGSRTGRCATIFRAAGCRGRARAVRSRRRRRRRCFRLVRLAFERLAAEHPLVLVLDDSTGPSRRSSTSSSTSRAGAATRRSCSSASRGPSCSTRVPPGAAAAERDLGAARAAERGRERDPGRRAPSGRPARRAARPRIVEAARGQPALRRGDARAMLAEGGCFSRARGSLHDPGADRGAPRLT